MASETGSDSPARPTRASRRKPAPRWILVLAAAVAAILPALWLINLLVPRPEHLGAVEGRLAACPDSPNCVGSQSDDPAHRVEPLAALPGPAASSLARLKRLLSGRPGVRLVTESPTYLHYEFRTRLCRFVDDVEFLADESRPVIQVRSASRLGYSDLGTNRRRIEQLRREWNALLAEAAPPR